MPAVTIKRTQVHAIGSYERVRMPRQPLAGAGRAVEKTIRDALATRPELPKFPLENAA